MKLFSARALPQAELGAIGRHVSDCPECHGLLVTSLRERGPEPSTFTLAPEFWLRHEHLDYDQLVELSEGRLAADEHESIDAHLSVCSTCEEDVKTFLAFRKEIDSELKMPYSPALSQQPFHRRPWGLAWNPLAWKLVYSAAVIVVGIALLIGTALLLNRGTNNHQVQGPTPQMSPASTPAVAENLPSRTVSPRESPTETQNGTEPVVVLSDRGGAITVDSDGRVSGLDDVPAPTRSEIAQVLLSGKIDRPRVLKDLGGEDSKLRGTSRGEPFKLTSPGRTVIVSNRPTFKWGSMSGATSYKVYINDATGQIMARSDALTPDHREWLVPKPLKRGEIYTWTVAAVVDGKETISPGPSAPEMKFQVLSSGRLRQLDRVIKTHSHAALGIFYAQAGMTAEAERQFQILVRNNPRSPHAAKLLKEIQVWQRH